jgi:hypothetical protein
MNQSINQTIQKTQRYWYEDGLAEMAVGLLLFIMAFYYFLFGVVKPFSASNWVLAIGQPLLFLLCWWGGGKAVKAVKERLTYPRTGYVTYPRSDKKKRYKSLGLSLVVSCGSIILLMVLNLNSNPHWIVLFIAVMFGIGLIMLAYKLNLQRFYFLAVYSLMMGGLVALLKLDDPLNIIFLFAGLGVGYVISGGVGLSTYLRNTRVILAEEDYE